MWYLQEVAFIPILGEGEGELSQLGVETLRCNNEWKGSRWRSCGVFGVVASLSFASFSLTMAMLFGSCRFGFGRQISQSPLFSRCRADDLNLAYNRDT